MLPSHYRAISTVPVPVSTITAEAGPWGALDAEISYMKSCGHLSHCPLKGTFGDTLFAILCGYGQNIRKILAHFQALFAWIIGFF